MKTHPVKIWDLPTRIFHWVLVAGIAFMWFSAEISDSLMDRHVQVGEFLLALILFRIIWGFVGSESSRFGVFLKSPGNAIQYAKTIFSRKPSWHAGHNPLGGWMVVALLLTVLGQASSGLFTSDDIMTEGPLYAWASSDLSDWMSSIHHWLFDVLIGLIVAHVGAILFYRIFKRTDLISAMVKGDAPWPEDEPVSTELKFRSAWLALVVFAGCYGGVYYGLRALV
uniref:Cytochrome B n=1 Tax=uncultured Thiotrichaceae bacterium TaxID=298394 RepID=A0A6S6TIP5_9GAMM|nr:MAG: Cytochrome B [uncultured Thiotrichaceae bacterium]